MFAVAPAQAAPARPATADPTILALPGLSTLYPQIEGLGTISGSYLGGSYSCTNANLLTGVFTCTDALPTALLGGSITATPLAGYQFDSWSNCPSGSTSTTCDLGAVSSLLTAPLAKFVPITGTGGGGGTDPAGTLTTLLTSKPEKVTGPDVLFQLGTQPADALATYTCTLSGPEQSGTPATCPSSVSYTGLPDGDYTFTALAKSDKFLQSTPASWAFTVASNTPLAPDTTVTGGPKNNGWLLGTATKFTLSSSSQLPVTYDCTLDGKALEGCTSPVELTRLAQRTHVFQAAASTAGVADSTPETRVFTVPVNNTKLKASAGWAKRKAKGHFLNTFSQTKRHGATLQVRRNAIKSVALVVAKGRGYGTVNVYLGKTLLKKVSLRANRTVGKRVVPIKKFSSKKHGTITVKVVSRGKLVRIEGLGIASR